MNYDQQLKIQSYVDGELSDREAKKVADWIASNPEARALCSELQFTRGTLIGNEPQVQVPESREFYWSKIAREIQKQENQTVKPLVSQPSPIFSWLQRLLVPAAGVAMIAALAVVAINDSSSNQGATMELGETEAHEMNAFTFRSQSERMTVVWVSDRSSGGIANDALNVNPYE